MRHPICCTDAHVLERQSYLILQVAHCNISHCRIREKKLDSRKKRGFCAIFPNVISPKLTYILYLAIVFVVFDFLIGLIVIEEGNLFMGYPLPPYGAVITTAQREVFERLSQPSTSIISYTTSTWVGRSEATARVAMECMCQTLSECVL